MLFQLDVLHHLRRHVDKALRISRLVLRLQLLKVYWTFKLVEFLNFVREARLLLIKFVVSIAMLVIDFAGRLALADNGNVSQALVRLGGIEPEILR